ncbi:MAG: Mur ligase domain-containing protein, partial [Elusimicrobiota bacterium]|nr:Mur ligase domain-containing protein [Elusimicrobiota bacterium]
MKEEKFKKMYFTGIAGAGMSALSQIAAMEGHEIGGSDRDFDNDRNFSLRHNFEKLAIKIFPQDGSGISKETDVIIVSTAVENENPDILKAKELNIPIIHRSEFLADYVNRFKTIAVAGTSGKSTVAAMIYEILEKAGKSPSIITGAALESIKRKGLAGNAWRGKSDILIVEADESDGTIINYYPHMGVILNISKDHKDEDEIEEIFLKFAKHTKNLYINSSALNAAVFPKAELFG